MSFLCIISIDHKNNFLLVSLISQQQQFAEKQKHVYEKKNFFGQFGYIKIGDMSNACQGNRIKISSFSILVADIKSTI